MTIHAKFALAAALSWAAAGCASPARIAATAAEPPLSAQSRRDLAERASAGWAETPRLAARLLMHRYGPPDEVGMRRMIWHGNGPWKRTVVRDADSGVIEQTVACSLTPEQAAALAPFSDRLTFDPAGMEMASRSDREEANFARLNLANDVLRGVLTVPQARESYARILALDAAGKTEPYLRGLSFGPGSLRTP